MVKVAELSWYLTVGLVRIRVRAEEVKFMKESGTGVAFVLESPCVTLYTLRRGSARSRSQSVMTSQLIWASWISANQCSFDGQERQFRISLLLVELIIPDV